MAELKDYFNISDDTYCGIWGIHWTAMIITTSSTYSLEYIKLQLARYGNPGTLTISIQELDGAGKPDGIDIDGVTGTYNGNSLPSGFANRTWVQIDLSDRIVLSSSTQYAIVARATTGDEDNFVYWGVDSAGNYPDGGNRTSDDSGSNWSILHPAQDNMFEFYGGYSASEVIPTDKTYSKKLVAIAGNQVWYESSAGTMSVLSDATDDIDCSNPLYLVEAYEKIFVVNYDNLKVIDFGNIKLHTTDILPTNKAYPRHGTVITGDSSGAQAVVDYITALDGDTYVYAKRITSATFVSGDVCEATIDEGDVSFTLDADEVSGPHWYDWTVYGNSSNYGTMPNKATLGCNYMGRVTLSGNPESPHQWYMPRQENPWDWLYGINDAQSAVAGNDADAGEIGDIVRALAPYKDDYLINGCVNSMWLTVGNPCEAGEIVEWDLTTGIFGPKSWCFDGDGNFYFFGTNGFYKGNPPDTPICISALRLPNLVEDEALNPSTHRIILDYDRKRNGIIIAITTLADGTNSNYFYDLRSLDNNGIGGLFPETYPEECAIYSGHYYEAEDPDYRTLLLGCTDGYIRYFDPTSKSDILDDDSEEAIDSYINFAPIPMGKDPNSTGKLTGLDCVTAGGQSSGSQSDSDDIYYKVFTDITAEGVLEKISAGTDIKIGGTISGPGRKRGSSIKRKTKNVYMGIQIGNSTAGETWGFEQLLIDLKESGRLK